MNFKCWLFGERTVIFEHPSTVESWYCSMREHEKLFCLTFSTVENDVQTNGEDFYWPGLKYLYLLYLYQVFEYNYCTCTSITTTILSTSL
jgi:hypothetical protein